MSSLAASAKANAFLGGVCVALQCVAEHDQGTVWREIVLAAGESDLLNYAAFVEPDEWELAGFSRYASLELGRRKPRKPRKAVQG